MLGSCRENVETLRRCLPGLRRNRQRASALPSPFPDGTSENSSIWGFWKSSLWIKYQEQNLASIQPPSVPGNCGKYILWWIYTVLFKYINKSHTVYITFAVQWGYFIRLQSAALLKMATVVRQRRSFTFCLSNNNIKHNICSLTHVPVYYCNWKEHLQKYWSNTKLKTNWINRSRWNNCLQKC